MANPLLYEEWPLGDATSSLYPKTLIEKVLRAQAAYIPEYIRVRRLSKGLDIVVYNPLAAAHLVNIYQEHDHRIQYETEPFLTGRHLVTDFFGEGFLGDGTYDPFQRSGRQPTLWLLPSDLPENMWIKEAAEVRIQYGNKLQHFRAIHIEALNGYDNPLLIRVLLTPQT